MVAMLAAIERPAPSALGGERLFASRPPSGGDARGGVAVASTDDDVKGLEEPEEVILRRAQRGDRDAFVRLMEQHDRRLRSLAYRLLDDRESMIEAMQDVYVKAFAGLPAFQGRSSVGTWLYRITYTTCLDHLDRRRLRAAPYADDEPPALHLVRDPADEATLHADLAAALRALSSEARAAILMVDRDGYDYRTAATALGIPMGTLASRLSAARAALRRALESGEGPR